MTRYLERCPFCFAEHGCKLGFTKKSRPYLVCRICQSRAFLNSREALRGVAVAPTLITSLVRKLTENDPNAQWARERIAELNALVTASLSDNTLPVSVEEAVPFVDHAEAEERIA